MGRVKGGGGEGEEDFGLIECLEKLGSNEKVILL